MSVTGATSENFGVSEQKFQRLEKFCENYEKSYGAINYTPNQVIDIKDITASTLTGFETASELIYFEHSILSPTIGSTTHQLQTSAAVQHSDLMFIVRNADFINKIKNALYKGTTIPSIKISKLQNEGDMVQKSEEIEFKNCKVQFTCPVMGNFHIFTSRYDEVSHTIFKRDQESGEQGQSVSGINLRTCGVNG